MPFDLFAALVVFACVMAFTPGPNNILLAASGVNFGFARTIPHMAGVAFGFFILLVACAAGLGLVFVAVPELHIVLKVVGAAYMLWLAYKVATAHMAKDAKAPARPFTFLQAALFQWVNPKGIVAAVSAIAIFVRPDHQHFDIPIMLAAFSAATIGSVLTWSAFGVALRGLLREPSRARIFNFTMAALLIASILPMVRAA